MKRKLRPSIKKALEFITIMLVITLMSVDSFEFRALPFLAMLGVIAFCNVKILEKF